MSEPIERPKPKKNVRMIAYISRTEPHRMFREVSLGALIKIVKPGRIKTTPADEIDEDDA
jgi:hypothetical protein